MGTDIVPADIVSKKYHKNAVAASFFHLSISNCHAIINIRIHNANTLFLVYLSNHCVKFRIIF